MFILKALHKARMAQAEHARDLARAGTNEAYAQLHRMEGWLTKAQKEAAFYKEAYNKAMAREESARLAARQTNQRPAGELVFDRIARSCALDGHYSRNAEYRLRTADLSSLEARVIAYEGHAGDGGIQRHSIGEEYPFVVYGQESATFGVVYRVLDTRNGKVYFDSFRSSKAASTFIARCKKYNRTFTDNGFCIERSK